MVVKRRHHEIEQQQLSEAMSRSQHHLAAVEDGLADVAARSAAEAWVSAQLQAVRGELREDLRALRTEVMSATAQPPREPHEVSSSGLAPLEQRLTAAEQSWGTVTATVEARLQEMALQADVSPST